MKKPDWLNAALEAHARRILDGAFRGAVMEDTWETSALYDDGTYRILRRGDSDVRMELTNSIENIDPDASQMVALTAALAWISKAPILLNYNSDTDNIDADVKAMPGESPETLRERFDADIHARRGIYAIMDKERDSVIAQLQALGDFTITPVNAIVGKAAAFEVTFTQDYSREELNEKANRICKILRDADEVSVQVAGMPLDLLFGQKDSPDIAMAGVRPGRSNQLLVHIPKSYSLSLEIFNALKIEAQRGR